jgi:hypothetical protein
MNAKEKAQSLVDKYMPLVTQWDCYHDTPLEREDKLPDAKQCAIICVNEILDQANKILLPRSYWEKVLQEINAL